MDASAFIERATEGIKAISNRIFFDDPRPGSICHGGWDVPDMGGGFVSAAGEEESFGKTD
jgi:hypothetical protein